MTSIVRTVDKTVYSRAREAREIRGVKPPISDIMSLRLNVPASSWVARSTSSHGLSARSVSTIRISGSFSAAPAAAGDVWSCASVGGWAETDGLEALESRFDAVGLRYWQIDRPSVV
ncbi:hypothetical protein GCM10009788_42190 [Nocardioides humi]|uniref:Uncharacterized protein n=1 Tax=Nocardioides humi TaxID=449461 RepID=A0ABN2BAG8_9ACTN